MYYVIHAKANVKNRVIYDRVRNKKNNFEITAFLNYERGTSRAGNSKSNENINKKFLFSFDVLNFPALDFPRSICRNFKIIFPLPYPIIYNPEYTYLFLDRAKLPKKEGNLGEL